MATCTFFGHSDVFDNIEAPLYEAIENLILNHEVTEFYVGNNGKFDFIVYTALSKLHEKYNYISFSAVLAYLDKEQNPALKETIYPEGLETVPKRFAISWRNKWMLNRADYVITYIKRPFGGAYKFYEMAKSTKKTVINICK